MTLANFFVHALLVVTIAWAISSSSAKPIQVLPNLPGFIPVYIRHGNEPLENINPSLAAAFHEGKNMVNTALPLEHREDASSVEDTIDDNESQNPFVPANKKKRDIPHPHSAFLQ